MSDKSSLLTSMEMSGKKRDDATKDLYFEDGERVIDYVLAYEIVENEAPEIAKKKADWRKTYLENIINEGLEIEETISPKNNNKEEYGTFGETKKEDVIRFVKVHAPFNILCEYAEDLKMKMPIKDYDININEWYHGKLHSMIENIDPFVIRDKHTRDEKKFFVKVFDQEQLSQFIYSDKPFFFSTIERRRIVYSILEKTHYDKGELDLGIDNLQANGIFLDIYPLHSGPVKKNAKDTPINDRQFLQEDWASLKRIFKYQPIEAIRSYFGEKVALYFAWLGLYTTFLVPAAIVGFFCFLYGVISAYDSPIVKEVCNPNNQTDGTYKFYMCPLCDKICSYYLLHSQGCIYSKITHFFDNDSTLFFAVFMSLWATIYLEFWKRKEISLAYEWHTMDFEEEEERPRPEYLAKVTRLKKNPVTMKMEPYMPTTQRYTRLFGAFGVVLFFMVLVLSAVVGVIIFRAAFYIFLIGQRNETVRSRSKMVVSACAACVNLVAINLLKFVYQRIAVKLTNWENPRTATDYEDSFTIKMFWFQFVNTYASIFYVAFFKSEFFVGSPGNYKRFTSQKFRFDGCSVQGCFLELTIQLVIIMVGQQIIGNTMEILIPFLKNKYRNWRYEKLTSYTASDEPQWVTDFEGEMQTKFSLFWQYLEIVLQFGFVTMFVAAFPLAPLVALLNNIIEIRLDAVNFIHNFRRTHPSPAEDIGAWYGILATLTMFSTIVNAFVLAFTSELIPRLVWIYYKSPDGKLDGFTDWSMSKFRVADFLNDSMPENPTKNGIKQQEYCRYPGFHEDTFPYKYSRDYWVVLTARLAFVIAFQAFVLTVKETIAYLIPDVPKSLELKIKREKYLAEQHDRVHKEKVGKRKPKILGLTDSINNSTQQNYDERLEPAMSPMV
ncbi:anoctamin-4 isoform X3 [Hydra vulgaris]|uniref:Anoctamin n=1 Tax=Hydra vulgaris TaxID=6087 RepID=A0ABM4CER9_HYDVU